jgi:hypothetical protein
LIKSFPGLSVVGLEEPDQVLNLLLSVGGANGNIVDPRPQKRVEKLLPLFAHVEDEAAAEKEVFEPEAGRHAAVVEEVLERAVGLESDLLGGVGTQGVRGALPRLQRNATRLSRLHCYSHSRKSFSAVPPACLGRRAGDSRAGRQCS